MTATQSASIVIDKTASPTTVTAAGQIITYTFMVTNTSNVTLTDVNVTDNPTPPAGGVIATCQSLSDPTGSCSGTTTTLLPGQIASFTGTYVVTQTDIDNGKIVDRATATGTPPSGPPVSDSSDRDVVVVVTQTESLSIVKSASPTTVTGANQAVTYTFMVTNTGNVTLTDVGVKDNPVAPAGGVTPTCQVLSNPAGSCSGATTSLAPGQIATFSGIYTVTQADIDQGSIVDTATATGTPPSGRDVTATSAIVTVDVTESPGLSVLKSASPTSVTAAGQSVTYTFTVTDSGNETLTDVGVTDMPTAPAGGVSPTCQHLTNPAGTCSGATTSLDPGQIATFTGTYVVSQADVDHGSIGDSALAAGTTPSDTPVTAPSNPVTVTVSQSPGISIVKAATPTTVTAANQSVNYTFTVTNSGDVTLTGVGVTDVPTAPAGVVAATCQGLTNPVGTCSGATTTLAPGQIADFTGTYVVTQADVDHGSIVDDATTQGTTPSGGTATAHFQHGDGHRDPIARHLHRQGGHTDHGDRAEPERRLHLHGHQLRQRDPHRCGRDRRADRARRRGHRHVSGSDEPGRNLLGGDHDPGPWTDSGLHGHLCGDPGGRRPRLHRRRRHDPGHHTLRRHDPVATSDTVTVNVTQSPSLSIVKSATPTTVTAANQSVDYTFTVTNSGNVTLTGVGVTDVPTAPAGVVTATCQSLSGPTGTCSGTTTTLLPQQSALFTGSYTVTQADVDHGSIVDDATTQGTTPSGGTTPVATSNPVTVNVTPTASLTIAKSATPTTVTAANQSVTYTFTVANTGNLTLTTVGVTDVPTAPAGIVIPTCTSLSSPAGTCTGTSTTLLPGQIATFTGIYTVTQADIDHGSIVDSAVAAGTTPSDTSVTADSNSVTVDVTQSGSLSIAKSASPTTVTAADQTINYTFTVTNTGNVTLTGVGVTDVPTAPAGGVNPTCQILTNPGGTCSGATTSLEPGQTAIFTGPYTVTQADVDNGSVIDVATTQGTTPSGGTTPIATSNTVTVDVTPSPLLSISKTADPTTVTAANQTINYTFTVTNTGNVTLTGVGVTDVPTAPAGTVTTTCQSLSTPTGTCSGATTTLVPGQSADFTGIYTVTQTDIDNGSIADTATAAGTSPSGGTITADSNLVTVDVTQSPSLSITKAADPTTVTAAGQTVTYTFTVENTGNSTITGVTVTDLPTPPAGGIVPDCLTRVDPAGTCSGTSTSLVPGETAVFSGTYTVTQADIDNGSIVDTAMTTGTAPSGDTVTATSNQVTVVVTQSPSLSIEKSADPMLVTAVGQVVTYTFTVANTGNVTLTGVGVTDVPTAPAGGVTPDCQSLSNPAGTCSGATTALVPGQIATFTGDYTVTQEDIDNGSIVDDATTHGTTPSAEPRTRAPTR